MFLYGTHYSTPAFVSFFLVRQYPEWQLCLQNGRFDHPNRLFHSFADSWRNCNQSDSDVKELIPEFYDTHNFTGELGGFLQNSLELDLGMRQDGVRVNDVVLPRWAHGSPGEFITRMRDALESSYVSENLHKWIDLIFGCKQRGAEALNADNLFYYLCYEGAVDLDSIKNYSERKSLEIQIQEFGQIPTQLFMQPHLHKVKIDLRQSIDMSAITHFEHETEEPANDDTEGLNFQNLRLRTKSKLVVQEDEQIRNLNNKYSISANNFKQIVVKFSVKLHKGQVNDCMFIDTQCKGMKRAQDQFDMPLVCSVSCDNWLKIYSLEEKSLFRSHNVSDFSLSSVDCIQISSDQEAPPTEPLPKQSLGN